MKSFFLFLLFLQGNFLYPEKTDPAFSYVKPGVQDGDQKTVKIYFAGKSKIIKISNYYQKDIGQLFNVLNTMISEKQRIQ